METTQVTGQDHSRFHPDSDFEQKHLDAMGWLHETACGLVDAPGSVFIEVTVTDTLSVFVLRIAEEDLGKIVGKRGRHAHALRGIFYAIGRRLELRFDLDIETATERPRHAEGVLIGRINTPERIIERVDERPQPEGGAQ